LPVTVPVNAGLGNVCVDVQVFGFPKFSDAITAPVVGLIVSVLSEFATELTAAAPEHEPHDGVELAPLSRHCPAVDVPAKIASVAALE
jgi:hypothetical protein